MDSESGRDGKGSRGRIVSSSSPSSSSRSSRQLSSAPASDYKKKYKTLKKKLKFLVYEQETLRVELGKSQRRLIQASRDKNFLLDRLLQYEDVEDSDADSDATASSAGDSDREDANPQPSRHQSKSAGEKSGAEGLLRPSSGSKNAAKSTGMNLPSSSRLIFSALSASSADRSTTSKASVPGLPLASSSNVPSNQAVASCSKSSLVIDGLKRKIQESTDSVKSGGKFSKSTALTEGISIVKMMQNSRVSGSASANAIHVPTNRLPTMGSTQVASKVRAGLFQGPSQISRPTSPRPLQMATSPGSASANFLQNIQLLIQQKALSLKSIKNRPSASNQSQQVHQPLVTQLLKQIQLQQALQKQQQNSKASDGNHGHEVGRERGTQSGETSSDSISNLTVGPKGPAAADTSPLGESNVKQGNNSKQTKTKRPPSDGHETISEILAAKKKQTRKPQQKISAMFKIDSSASTPGSSQSVPPKMVSTATDGQSSTSSLDSGDQAHTQSGPMTPEKIKESIIQQLRTFKDQQQLQQLQQRLPLAPTTQLSVPQRQIVVPSMSPSSGPAVGATAVRVVSPSCTTGAEANGLASLTAPTMVGHGSQQMPLAPNVPRGNSTTLQQPMGLIHIPVDALSLTQPNTVNVGLSAVGTNANRFTAQPVVPFPPTTLSTNQLSYVIHSQPNLPVSLAQIKGSFGPNFTSTGLKSQDSQPESPAKVLVSVDHANASSVTPWTQGTTSARGSSTNTQVSASPTPLISPQTMTTTSQFSSPSHASTDAPSTTSSSESSQQQISQLLQNLQQGLNSPIPESSVHMQQHSFVSHQLEMLRESLEGTDSADKKKTQQLNEESFGDFSTNDQNGAVNLAPSEVSSVTGPITHDISDVLRLPATPQYYSFQQQQRTPQHDLLMTPQPNTQHSPPPNPESSPQPASSGSAPFPSQASTSGSCSSPSSSVSWNRHLSQRDRNHGLLGQRVPVTLPKDIFNDEEESTNDDDDENDDDDDDGASDS